MAIHIPLRDVLSPCKMTLELYGYRRMVVDSSKVERALWRALRRRPHYEEIETFADDLEGRLRALRERAGEHP